MLYILLAIVGVWALLWGLKKYNLTKVLEIVQRLRVGAGMLAIGAAVFLALRGNCGHGISLAMLGGWLLSGVGLKWPSLPGPGWPRRGPRSAIATDHLDVELEQETGAMRGRILKGVFAGRRIERLAPAELALLWRDCQHVDPTSAQLIGAWLDRTHPTWRIDMARAENSPGAGGIMTPKEAYEILGLRPGATPEDIRRSHRDLMKRMHPDAGGSSYLASKINEAKDVLLGR